METRSSSRAKYALAAVMATIIFVIMYKYAYYDLVRDGYADLKDHMHHADGIFYWTLKESWLERPYLFWHLCVKVLVRFTGTPIYEATSTVCGAFAAFNSLLTFFIIDKLVSRYQKTSGLAAALASGMLNYVFPLYVSWFNTYHYEGQFSINPYFNPTHMAVKPFGLLAFALALDLIMRYRGDSPIFFQSEKFERFRYAAFGLALFWSVFTKPTFAYMLLPTGALYLIAEWLLHFIRKDGECKKTWAFMVKIGCASLPAVCYVLLEYAAFYLWGGTNEDAKVAVYPFLTAWHLYSPNVLVSIILAMLFPLWMFITNIKYFLGTVEGRLGVLGYVVGALEFSFFVETGFKLTHLNFSWPMMSGMLLFWVVATARLVHLTCSEEDSKWGNAVVMIGWIFMIIHVCSGLVYLTSRAYIL